MSAKALLAFMIAHASPGGSLYSFEPVESCGTRGEEAACVLAPVCEADHDPRCRAPRWSAARGAWVRVETRATAERRFAGIAESAWRTALRLTGCREPDGTVLEDCELAAGWPRGPGQALQLAKSAVTVALWESGLREDIQGGHAPAGRGDGGEGCLMQVMPSEAPKHASWIPKKRRQQPWTRDEQEEVVQSMLGQAPEALDRCFEVGMRILARSRRACRGKGVSWTYGMFAMYGTGNTCSSAGSSHGDFAAKRQKTLAKLLAFREPG